MTVIGAPLLREMVAKYGCIYPSDESAFDGDGYVLTVREDRTLHYLEHRNMVSREIVFTPPDCVAHLTSKSKFGRLALELVNLSNERTPITIKQGDPLIHIEFLRREGPPEPYSGRYMFQFMNDAETARYVDVLSKNFSELYPAEAIAQRGRDRLVNE